jgi:hypothetical protein
MVIKHDLSIVLSLQSDDAAKLFVDGILQVQNTRPAKKQKEVMLQAGVRHVRVDFQEGQGSAVIRLNGLNFSGTDAYEFRRPALIDDEARCQESYSASVSASRSDASAP